MQGNNNRSVLHLVCFQHCITYLELEGNSGKGKTEDRKPKWLKYLKPYHLKIPSNSIQFTFTSLQIIYDSKKKILLKKT